MITPGLLDDLFDLIQREDDPVAQSIARRHLALLHTTDRKGLDAAQVARKFRDERQQHPDKTAAEIARFIAPHSNCSERTVLRHAARLTKTT